MTLTPEQISNRAAALGGSDCAAALGVSRFKTARKLYHEKRGELPVEIEETDWLRFGTFCEPYVRQRYAEMTHRIVRLPAGTLVHPQYDWMIAHVDGFSAEGFDFDSQQTYFGRDEFRGYEGKTAFMLRDYGDEGTDQIPTDALLQCQHYTIVTGWPVFDVGVLGGAGRVKLYEICADEEMQSMIVEGEAEFMRRVIEGDPPPLDYEHRTALDLLKRLYPGTNGKRIKATDQAMQWRVEMDEASELEKQGKATRKAYQARLLELMGEAALLDFSDGKSYRRQQVDKQAYTVGEQHYMDSRFINTPH